MMFSKETALGMLLESDSDVDWCDSADDMSGEEGEWPSGNNSLLAATNQMCDPLDVA